MFLTTRRGETFFVKIAFVGGEYEFVLFPEHIGLLPGKEIVIGLADKRFARNSDECTKCIVEQRPAMVSVLDEDRVGNRVDYAIEKIARGPEFGFHPLALGDV